MALINCPECGRIVSNSAPQCPNCGYPVSKKSCSHPSKYILDYITKRPLLFFVLITIIICSSCLIKLADSKPSYSSSSYQSAYSSSSSSNSSSASIFKNLTISNFSASLGTNYGRMSCEVLNTNSFTVNGYFRVGFYDNNGNLMYDQLMPLPSVAKGETVICSTLISKDDYPSGYSYVKYSQATLVKD